MSKIVPFNQDWKRLEQDRLALGAYMKPGEENGDTDWYDPKLMPPQDGEPIYLKMEVVFKAWHIRKGTISQWVLEDMESHSEKMISWQKREDAKNYHDKSDECKPT